MKQRIPYSFFPGKRRKRKKSPPTKYNECIVSAWSNLYEFTAQIYQICSCYHHREGGHLELRKLDIARLIFSLYSRFEINQIVFLNYLKIAVN